MTALQNDQKSYADLPEARLFAVLAESLKQPFTTIARTAELLVESPDVVLLRNIESTADAATQLLDHYLLSLRLQRAGTELNLEPVSLAASLTEVAHKLEKAAQQYLCDIELHIAGRYEPIMAHSAGLSAALLDLGTVFLETQSQRTHTHRPVLKLAAHRTRHGIVAGIFADVEGLSTDMFRRARQVYGQAATPLNQVTSTTGAGIFVADALLKNMSGGLRVAHHQKLTGLAATFVPSQQLVLV